MLPMDIKEKGEAQMKKTFVVLGIVMVIGLIVFTLIHNKKMMEEKAAVNALSSYTVSVIPASKKELNSQLSQTGTILANNDVAIVSEVTGKVTAIMVSEGAYVQNGSPLLKVEDDIPEANFLAAKTNYQKAQKDYDSYQSLYSEGLISESDLDGARLAFKSAEAQYIGARKQYKNSVITSPIAGVVTARPVNVGTMVSQGTVVANVIDNSSFKVKLNIGEQEAFRLRVGDPVTVTTDVYPGVKLGGKVKSISDKADGAHTYPVEVLISSSREYPLKSGMFGTLTFNLGVRHGLTIPRNSIVGSIKNPQVFVVQNGTAILRNIVTGPANGTDIVVTNGLSEGERVIAGGQNNLQDGMKVKVVN